MEVTKGTMSTGPGEGLREILWKCNVRVKAIEARPGFAADYHKMAKHFTEFTNINSILHYLAVVGG